MKHSGLTAPSSNASIAAIELEIADVLGTLMHFWGFKRAMGRTWGLLYLSRTPVPAGELAERLKSSAGATSMTLTELIRWGAVRKTWQPGQRRDYYEAETRVYQLLLRVLRERELPLVRNALEILRRSRTLFPKGRAVDPNIAFKRAQLNRLCRIAEVGERLLNHLVAGQAVDPRIIQDAAASPNSGAEFP